MIRRLVVVGLILMVALLAPFAVAIGILRVAEIDALRVFQSLAGTAALPPAMVEFYGVLQLPLQILFVGVLFFIVWLVSRISFQLAGWLLRATRYDPDQVPRDSAAFDYRRTGEPRPAGRRRQTVQQLLASFINLTAFTIAAILAVSQFVNLSSLAIVATIAANAFGFAARDYIGDLLNGLSNIFENRFVVGDNVSIVRVGDKIEGVVEQVTVRTLSLRTRGGELINVPQGEVRILRNYTRGSFTGTDVTCRVAPENLPSAMTVLLALGEEAPVLLPDIMEPWTLVAQDGEMGSAAQILIHAKARYGHGADLRLQMMVLIEERLTAAGIPLAS